MKWLSLEREMADIPATLQEDILDRALERAASLYGLLDPSGWSIGREIRTRSATLFSLKPCPSVDARILAYYKVYDERFRSKVEARLARTSSLTDRLAGRCEGTRLAVPHTLALDLERRTIVMSAVPGEQLGTLVRRSLTAGGRRSTLDVYGQIGDAIRMIESVARPVEPVLNDALLEGVDHALHTARDFLSPDSWGALNKRIWESYESARSEAEASYVHGDLSGGNILLSSGVLGIVDFQWPARWSGFDLATMGCRTILHPAVDKRWGRALIRAMIEGYGDKDVTESSAWTFYTLQRTLQFAVKKSRRWSHGLRSLRAKRVLEGSGGLS